MFEDDFKLDCEGNLIEKFMLKGIEKNDVESIVKFLVNYEELCKLVIVYFDGVI